MASEAEEKARRVRSLLSSYYGSSGDDAPFAPGARVPADPIDAPDFDAERYVRETLERTPLDALLSKCASMREEARRLDGDAQTLVYDNYSTFIAAADAVRDVRARASAMEEKMAEAKRLISATVNEAERVDETLSLRRDQVLALSGVRTLIAKLQCAFDVPEKMRAALDRGAPGAAAHYYAAVRPLLAKHGDRGAFVAVKQRAELEAARARAEIGEAMAEAATRAADAARARRTAAREPSSPAPEDGDRELANAVVAASRVDTDAAAASVDSDRLPPLCGAEERPSEPRSNPSASECARLLEKLGAPRGESRAAFVRSHRAPMERALTAGESSVSSSSEREAIHADPRAFVARLDGDFLEAFHRFAGEYLEVFGADDGARGELVDASRPLFRRYFAVLKLALDASSEPDPSARASERRESGDPSREAVATSSSRPLVPAKGLMAALATMAADLSSAHRLVPSVGLGDRAAEVVERAVRGRVGAAFAALERKLVAALDELETKTGTVVSRSVGSSDASLLAELKETTARLAAIFAGGVAEALDDARALLEERPVMVMGWRAEFEGLVRAESQTVARATLARLAAAGVADGDGARLPKALRVEREDRSPLAESTRRYLAGARDCLFEVPRSTRSFEGDDASERDVGGATAASTKPSSSASALRPSFDPLFALACARTAAFVRDEGVDAVAAQLDRCFPPRRDAGDGARAAAGTEASALAASRARADEAALFLAAAYARARGDAIAAMLRRTMRAVDWAEAREPRDVRPVVDALLEEIARVDAEAATTLGGVSETVSETVPTLEDEGGNDAGASPERGSFVSGYAPRSCARDAVTASVVRFVLRAFSEILSATRRFSRGGFHQTELDLAFAKPKLVAAGAAASPADAKAVEDLLLECIAAAAARTADPAPLDPAIIARILDAKQSRGGG